MPKASNEGKQVARRLSKKDWKIEYDTKNNQYTATHPDAEKTIRWKSAVTVQRVLDEANQALGQPPLRTSSGRKRKEHQEQQREHEANTQQSLEKARSRATQDLLVLAAVEKTSMVPDRMRQYYDELTLTSTHSAVKKAAEFGIPGRKIQQALMHPVGVLRGYNDCVVYVGGDCKVVVSPIGYIVAVLPHK